MIEEKPRVFLTWSYSYSRYVKLGGSSRCWISLCGDNHPESQQACVTCCLLALLLLLLKPFDTAADWQQLILPPDTRVRCQRDFLILLTPWWSGALIVPCSVAHLFQTPMSVTDNFKQPIREKKHAFPFSDLIRPFTDTHQEAVLVSSCAKTECSFACCEGVNARGRETE